MNKTEFTEYLAKQMDSTKSEASRWLETVIEGIHKNIKDQK